MSLDARTACRVAVAGNPNVGKSSLFNALTGGRQHVGNWPGKTVEHVTGVVVARGRTVELTDLPGTYGLSALSLEEEIARDHLLGTRPDAAIVVVDATNLERSLYLALEVLELGIPVVVALNMTDLAATAGIHIDADRLAAHLGCVVVATVASRGDGVDALVHAAVDVAAPERGAPPSPVDYGPELEAAVETAARRVAAVRPEAVGAVHPEAVGAADRWLARRLLEGDPGITVEIAARPGGADALAEIEVVRARLLDDLGPEGDGGIDLLVAERRYACLHDIVVASVHREERRRSPLDVIDRLATHRVAGIPFFLAVMWVVFKLTTDVAKPLSTFVGAVVNGPIAHAVNDLLRLVSLDDTWMHSLLIDGLLHGVGQVLVFIPVMGVMFTALALLEDTGYMARAAFVVDRAMRGLGLHGKSFLPLLVGFGCNVPGIGATRILENRRDRVLTGLLVPYMSCSARLPVYVLVASTFFAGSAGTVVFSMYVLSGLIAVLVGLALRHTLFRRHERAAFLLELPPYRRPNHRTVARTAGAQVRSFLRKAGGIILVVVVAVWFLQAVPTRGDGHFAATPIADSAYAGIARAIAPALRPLGLDDWHVSGALVTGFVAKEVVVTSLAQSYGIPVVGAGAADPVELGWGATLRATGRAAVTAVADTVRELPAVVGLPGAPAPAPAGLSGELADDIGRTSDGHGRLAAYGLCLFVLVYVPCMSTLATQRKELGGRWALFSAVSQTTLAWLIAVVVVTAGRVLT